jgi:hypothetical protein
MKTRTPILSQVKSLRMTYVPGHKIHLASKATLLKTLPVARRDLSGRFLSRSSFPSTPGLGLWMIVAISNLLD